MQADLEVNSPQSLFIHEDEEKEFAEIAVKISEDFDFKLSFLELTNQHEGNESEGEDRNEGEVGDDNDDFSFAVNGSDSTVFFGDGASTDAQIRPYFPLFNQDLLLAREDYKVSDNRRPPVEKVFIESPPSTSSEKSESNAGDGIVAGPYCAWEKQSPGLSKKSNSTGFSKLWRFKEYLHRSHSDGRDAFVFFNNSETKREAKPVQKKTEAEASSEKKTVGVVTAGGKKVVKKGMKMTPPLSAHEVYLRSKGIYPDYDKRRAYLPYQPVLVVHACGMSEVLSWIDSDEHQLDSEDRLWDRL